MKKAVTSILIASLVILLVFSLCACSNEESKIIGEWTWNQWQAEHNTTSFDFSNIIKFNSDKTISGVVRKDGKPMETWTWSYDKENKRYNIENEYSSVWYATILANGDLLITSESRKENGTISGKYTYTLTKNDGSSSIERKLHTTYFFTTANYSKTHVAPDWIYFCEDGFAYVFVENPLVGTVTVPTDFHQDDVFTPASSSYETSLYKVSYIYNAKEAQITITPRQPIPIIKPKNGASRHHYTTGRDLGLGDPGYLKTHYYYYPEDIEITYFRETAMSCMSLHVDEWITNLGYINENQITCYGSSNDLSYGLQYYLDKYSVIAI